MPTLKTANGTIEVGNGRVVTQAERMGKLSAPRRAQRLEKAKALLADNPGAADASDEAGAKTGKGKGAKAKRAKAKAGKSKAAKAEAIRPALRQAAAIVLSQGIAEL
ncbi:MAG TPA: hypothetical protein VN681_02275 [Stellaceae bacterium]|nr:hypothetical protein [Stellaceae bacterium]